MRAETGQIIPFWLLVGSSQPTSSTTRACLLFFDVLCVVQGSEFADFGFSFRLMVQPALVPPSTQQHQLSHPSLSTLNPQPSTQHRQLSNLSLSTLNPQPSTLHPDSQLYILNPKPYILNLKPSTLNPQPSIVNRQLSTLNPKP